MVNAHYILIVVHTCAGLFAFIFGCTALIPLISKIKFYIFYYSLLVMLITLISVVLWDWQSLHTTVKIAYTFLVLLAAYTFSRGHKAKRIFRKNAEMKNTTYVDDVGFTLISLFDGFVIVSAIDLKAPGWLVGLIGALGIWFGIMVINYIKRVTLK